MDLDLRSKTVVLTGASMGIGRATAKLLALEGAQVLAVARTQELLNSLADEVDAEGGVRPILLAQDFVAPNAAEEIAKKAEQTLGHVDILVNNAAGSRPLPWDASDSVWEEAMTLNFDRHRQLTQALVPQMITRKSGRVISLSGTLEPDQVNAAAVAKAALVVWSKGLSNVLGQYGITVNCVEPGLHDTQQIRKLFSPEQRRQFAEQHISMRDFGEAEDVARAVVFLASGAASYITGSTLRVDGGMRYYSF
ncbi:SDR family oxidoreductase [Paraburkholderia sp. 22B1P]|uniref:SDR family NAD(P)-dependent oxidoreductase n=1 Tax=Paraburkholderia sp. 22B1P TaxID=3080498 RepID=UPI00308820F6|nr:SDR family oxidoreductase [Paraburkholderia sp. 22B1P]